jgi:bifunctional oligoribonuclease and PAP phosphatase NrnA
MHADFQQAKQLIEQSQSILLTTHERTDGDDFGVISALAHYLQTRNKSVTKIVKGGVPPHLSFLPDSSSTVEQLPEQTYDLLIISGCSNRERIGNQAVIELEIPTLNLDHHPDNQRYATVNVVDAAKSSVAELTFDLFHYAGWQIDPQTALALLTGIVTDTGSFIHSNTASSTLAAAASLMQAGAHLHTIAKHTAKRKDLRYLQAWSKALENAWYDEDRQIIYSVISNQDLDSLGNLPPAAFEGLVETLNKVPEAKFALFLKQDGAVIKGSLRSEWRKGVDVNSIARLFGGGGHTLASGFAVAGTLEKEQNGNWKIV